MENNRKRVIALGFFDGVHLGHQALLRRAMERSRARAIEQRYRAEIHRVERERFYRRIYKPP